MSDEDEDMDGIFEGEEEEEEEEEEDDPVENAGRLINRKVRDDEFAEEAEEVWRANIFTNEYWDIDVAVFDTADPEFKRQFREFFNKQEKGGVIPRSVFLVEKVGTNLIYHYYKA